MRKRIKITVIITVSLLIFGSINAQENSENYQGRYIVVDDITTFFMLDKTENIIVCNFDLYNIFEQESSKPVFVDVNELTNVVKFGIKSSSEQYENQRSCYLKMNVMNYSSTFRLVLDRMNVKMILYQGEFILVNDFISKII
ncbi:MAG: hypothetical protein PHH30_09095 [Bacteroidales bacterium]|nr:hypothetical protein [Bacteroidales bacterium]MDD3860898.1 hypothetical protein [Bacteroidales bacterium]